VVMVEKVVVMNYHVQQKVKVGKTVCDEASMKSSHVAFSYPDDNQADRQTAAKTASRTQWER